MDYIYDILINLNNNKNYEFYEWRDSDNIYHIRKVPIIKVSEEQFLDIKKNNFILNKSLLDRIKNKTEVYQDLNVLYINYLCAFACNYNVIVIEFNKDGYSINKSNMLLEEEDDTLYEISELDEEHIDYEILDENYSFNLDNTRYEEEIKNSIRIELNETLKCKDYNKLKYLYYEWYKKKSNNIKKIIDEMQKIIEIDYNDKHDELYSVLKLSKSKN